MNCCRYDEFVREKSARLERLDRVDFSKHALEINATTVTGSQVTFSSAMVTPFFLKALVNPGVLSSLRFETRTNPMITTSAKLSSERILQLQSALQLNPNLRLTLEADEAATDRAPASLARLGCDFKSSNQSNFAGIKVDAVNGPTVQGTCGMQFGNCAIGCLAAYDVGLDYSDRVGRISQLDAVAKYTSKEVCAFLQFQDMGKKVYFNLTQVLNPKLRVGTEVHFDRIKDEKTMRLRSLFELNANESVSTSLGSDGVLISVFEWRVSKHVQTRIMAQMDIRNYESDSHHLGISIQLDP